MARITIFGGTGYAGGHIAAEAARRGHNVVSITRTPPDSPQEGVAYETGSLHDPAVVEKAAADSDVIVIATHGFDPSGPGLIDALPALSAAAIAGGARLGVVGGAGSSLVAEGGPRLVDTPDFHEDWKPEALAHADVLAALRESDPALNWFYVSPAALFGAYAPGEATGSYRTGGDVLVTKEDGTSEISGADLALAFVDEIENRINENRRFTVGH
ncbi:NAD(P)-dependent oxidoreductase [Cryptosporangium japonicum]|uniref:NAD(P)H-binding protein n=1 Tax=Cryptosporangium japonicum TaxID=80872 RepID=A0ABP3EQI3_9ACTN